MKREHQYHQEPETMLPVNNLIKNETTRCGVIANEANYQPNVN